MSSNVESRLEKMEKTVQQLRRRTNRNFSEITKILSKMSCTLAKLERAKRKKK
jgi:hypothetical protein